MTRLEEARALLRRAAAKAKELDDPAAKRALLARVTRNDPLAFALLFLPHHLTNAEGDVSLSSVHEGWVDAARRWTEPVAGPQEQRDAYVAPRDMGKSTWFFLLLPLWAAAHGHVRFAAAFADSASQAEGHLTTFKRELDTNALLREVFPDLCAPATRPRGTTVSDNRALLQTRSGFVFAARGIDSGNLGMKVGEQRPDLLILDDIEPGEANYSQYQVEKRLGTVTDVVLPLNVFARVVLVGTVTMPGSIVHQLVQRDVDPQPWIKDEGFDVHHALPFDDAGESVWPEKWSTEYLRSIEHTRSFAKNFLNQPVATDGDYWTPEVYTYGAVPGVTRTLLSIDPAVTTKTSSDFTGCAVVGFSPSVRRCVVRHAEAKKLAGDPLRDRVLQLLEMFPEITHVLVESNQGGDLWRTVLHGLPVPLVSKHNSDKKEVRAAECLHHYQRGRVLHEKPLTALEQQQCSFPKAPNDDLVDAVGNAVNRLLKPKPKTGGASGRSRSYT